jgi:hypothetical protein
MTKPVLQPLEEPAWVRDIEALTRRHDDSTSKKRFGLVQLVAALKRAYLMGVDPVAVVEGEIRGAERRQPKRKAGEGSRGPASDIDRHVHWRRAFPRLLVLAAMSRAADSARTLSPSAREKRVRRAGDRGWDQVLRRHGIDGSTSLGHLIDEGGEPWAHEALEQVLARRLRGRPVSHEEWACYIWNATEREKVNWDDWEEMKARWKKLTPSPWKRMTPSPERKG